MFFPNVVKLFFFLPQPSQQSQSKPVHPYHSITTAASISNITMDDPRRVEERERRKAGLFRRLGITRTPKPHPRIGGARGYSLEMRESELWSYDTMVYP